MKDIVLLILRELPLYLRNCLKLVVGPKRFLRERNRWSEARLTQALTFAGVSFALYSILFASSVPAGTDFLTRTATAGVFTLLCTALFGSAVTISWRLVGGKAGFGRHWITFLYLQAVFLIIFGIFLAVLFGLFELLLPELSRAARDMIMRGGRDVGDAFRNALDSATAAHQQAKLLAIATAGLLALLVPWIWLFAGWGAYRELNDLSRLRSLSAALVYLLLVFLIMPIVLLMSMGVG